MQAILADWVGPESRDPSTICCQAQARSGLILIWVDRELVWPRLANSIVDQRWPSCPYLGLCFCTEGCQYYPPAIIDIMQGREGLPVIINKPLPLYLAIPIHAARLNKWRIYIPMFSSCLLLSLPITRKFYPLRIKSLCYYHLSLRAVETMTYRPPFIDNVEQIDNYQISGFHPVHLGDTFTDGQYHILHKLGYGGFSTV